MGSECNWSRKDKMERRRGIRHASPWNTEWTRVMRQRQRRELPAILSTCLVSEKCSPSCTSTMPAHNDRGYCTPNHCVGETERGTEWWERQREKRWETERVRKCYKEPLKSQEESRACRYKPGQSCLANWGQFAAGEKCRTPQVVYNTENIWNKLSYTKNKNTQETWH